MAPLTMYYLLIHHKLFVPKDIYPTNSHITSRVLPYLQSTNCSQDSNCFHRTSSLLSDHLYSATLLNSTPKGGFVRPTGGTSPNSAVSRARGHRRFDLAQDGPLFTTLISTHRRRHADRPTERPPARKQMPFPFQ